MTVLKIRGLHPSEFPDQLYPLLEACFPGSKEDRRFYQLHFERPYDIPNFDYSRVLVLDGQIVSHICAWRFEANIAGGISLSGGGIRDVSTHPDHRKKGYGHLLLEDITRFMKDNGIDISLLYAGPKQFYEAKDWWSGIPNNSFELNLKDAKLDDNKRIDVSIEQMTSYDEGLVDQLLDIRKQTNKGLNFVVIRDRAYFHRLVQAPLKYPKSHVVYLIRITSSGELIGYFFGSIGGNSRENTASISEARVLHENIDDVLVGLFYELRSSHGCATLNVGLSSSHDICRVAIKCGAKDVSGVMSGAMLKILNLHHFMMAIASMVSSRKIANNNCSGKSLLLEITEPRGNDGILGTFVVSFEVDMTGRFLVSKVSLGNPVTGEKVSANGKAKIGLDLIVPILFSPLLDVEEAIEDELIRVEKNNIEEVEITREMLSIFFDGHTWDKEHQDYF